ncbi:MULTISPECIES: ABC transporter substrate-binding protein [Arcobacteraceae]|uniref:Thiamine biosynthesis protein n=1 Tax=Poseidonibacter parvus TaxID=1850254 RepID=A0A1P8KLM6_9BACT|nr:MULTISPECIES: ABC transporter substrate-binding protein [Arcobacteraceae]APW65436.1 thiamine biosynthesis protein [Poseidonibacter parvus]
MKKIISKITLGLLLLSSSAFADKEKVSLLLDWFVNPDHAAIIIAQQEGFFEKNNLEVEIIEPADPSMPPKLVAAKKADLAVDYQPQLQMQVAQGLPLVRIATLVNSPLNSLVVLKDSGIKNIEDLKGKKVGYSVSGFETALLDSMLKSVNLSAKDVELINVNWSLSPSLMSKQVDAVIGAFRNFELNQLKIEKEEGVAFFPENYGVPKYDELVVVANKETVSQEKYKNFVKALQEATKYLKENPKKSWESFVSYKPKELNNKLNTLAWNDTIPYLAQNPAVFDKVVYKKMATFMKENKLIKTIPNLDDYAKELLK